MASVESFLRRPTAILKMPQAIAQGMSANKFLSQLKIKGLGYSRTKFLADWRSVSGIEARKDVFKHIRKDRRPSMASLADVEWDMSEEYMFKVKVNFRTGPDEPMQERFVNIPSDHNMSPDEAVAAVFDRWSDWEKYVGEELVSATSVSGYHRIDELEPEI